MAKQSVRQTFVLGIDLGTSGCKACIVDTHGMVRGSGTSSYPILTPRPLWAEQNPMAWLPAVIQASRQAIHAARSVRPEIVAIALTSAAHIGVLLDRSRRPIRNAILWNDQRSVNQVRRLEAKAGGRILRRSCQAVSTTWTLPHLAWIRDNERRNWSRVHRVMLSKDFVIEWLTGHAVTDRATAVSSQLWDAHANCWSDELCDLIGLRTDQLPPVVAATDTAGALLPKVAEVIGLPAGAPVIVGTLDSATELIAAGVTSDGESMVRLATAGGLQWVVNSPTADRHRITYPCPTSSMWYCQTATNTCAAAVEWARALLSDGRLMSLDEWDRLASAAPPGADGLIFHPHLAGERAPYWDPALRGQFSGLTLSHGRAHIARAVYEGTAYSILDAMRIMPTDLRKDSRPITVVGGGTKSRIWLDILANVIARPLRVVPQANSATGAALLGLAALKEGDPRRSSASRAGSTIVRPNQRAMRLYAQQAKIYMDSHVKGLRGPR